MWNMVAVLSLGSGQSRRLDRVLRDISLQQLSYIVLESFAEKLHNQRLHWFTDNQNVVRFVLRGNRKSIVQVKALAIFATCV